MAQPTHFQNYVTVVTDIDRRKYGKRTVPMRVLCLGLGRTGTDSLRQALKLLGISDVYHGYPAYFENPRDCEIWWEALDAREGKGKPFGRAEFDMLLGHCQAIADHPCILFAEELIDAYPEALVILTLRPVDDWYRSTIRTLGLERPLFRLAWPLNWYLRLHSRYAYPVFRRCMSHLFGDDFQANGTRAFHEHNDKIRALVPKDRLLELHLGDGWGPLCKFLEVERPEVEYPRGNTASDLNKAFDSLFWYNVRIALPRLGLCVLLFMGIVFAARHASMGGNRIQLITSARK